MEFRLLSEKNSATVVNKLLGESLSIERLRFSNKIWHTEGRHHDLKIDYRKNTRSLFVNSALIGLRDTFSPIRYAPGYESRINGQANIYFSLRS